MQKFIFKTSIFSLLVITILTSVNYLGDGAKIFHTEYERKIKTIIFQNHNATNISNYDERILQKEIIQNINKSPDVLIIGSSRTMLISSLYFNNKKTINNSMSGASIEDIIAIYQMYKAKEILPKKIIIGIDPWLFNENNGQLRWKSLIEEYNDFRNNYTNEEKGIVNNKLKQLFSLSYFQASFKKLPDLLTGNSNPIATDDIFNETNTKLIDGSLSYGRKQREVSLAGVNNKAKTYMSGNIYSIEKFDKISSDIWEEFEELCLLISNENIELSFFLAPYHPLVYKKIREKYPRVLESEAKVRKFANNNSIDCLGSFDPENIGIDESGFYDGMHSKEKTIMKILQVRTHNNVYKSLGEW